MKHLNVNDHTKLSTNYISIEINENKTKQNKKVAVSKSNEKITAIKLSKQTKVQMLQ